MPIDYRLDHEQRLIVAEAHGTMTHEDVIGYQRDIRSRSELVGYDELIDMSDVKSIDLPSTDRVRDLARRSAEMDHRSSAPQTRFAIVAPGDEAFGLGRMFQTFRGFEEKGTKEVSVFRSVPEALAFLVRHRQA